MNSVKGALIMELAKITSKGQITLPVSIRRALKLNDGDKVAFVEENGQYVLANPAMLALRQAQDAFAGFAEENDLKKDEDVVAMIKEIRAERER
jgi:antitoxin PrlF